MLLSETTGNETLRYYYDSLGRVASLTYKKGSAAEVGYFFTRNLQGDIIGIYRSSDSKLIGTYEYDLWGKLVSVSEASSGIDTDGILTKNPFRYRGYYYDAETGFYNLNLRYYDPVIRRFISADTTDVLLMGTDSIYCKNLFAYTENNPVNGKDSSGVVVETVWDVVSLGVSIVDVCAHPSDPWAWVGLVGDVADCLIPCVGGIGEVVKGIRVSKVAKNADTLGDGLKAAGKAHDAKKVVESGRKAGSGADDIIQYEKLKSQYAADEIYNADRVGSALKEDPAHRAASYLSKEQMAGGRTYSITGGDNNPYTLLQVQGQLDGENGIFEYVMDGAGQVTHQRFIKGGIYTGFPNQVVPKGGY